MCFAMRSEASRLQAQDQLFHARRILGYSYVFAFFMFGQVMFADEITPAQNAINQNLFEDQQQQLEQVVCFWFNTVQYHVVLSFPVHLAAAVTCSGPWLMLLSVSERFLPGLQIYGLVCRASGTDLCPFLAAMNYIQYDRTVEGSSASVGTLGIDLS